MIYKYKKQYWVASALSSSIGLLIVYSILIYFHSTTKNLLWIEWIIIVLLPFLFLYLLIPSMIVFSKSFLIVDESGICCVKGKEEIKMSWNEIDTIVFKKCSMMHFRRHLLVKSMGQKTIIINDQWDYYIKAWSKICRQGRKGW
jgi:hypothetical protein